MYLISFTVYNTTSSLRFLNKFELLIIYVLSLFIFNPKFDSRFSRALIIFKNSSLVSNYITKLSEETWRF